MRRWHQGEELEIGPDFLREQKAHLTTPDRDSTRPQAPRRPAPPTPFQLQVARNADTSPLAPLDTSHILTAGLPELVQCPSPARPRAGRRSSPSPTTPPRLLQRKNSFIQPTKPVSPLSQCSQRSGSVGRTSLDGFSDRRPTEQQRSATLPLNRSKNPKPATMHLRSVSVEPLKCNCVCCIDNSVQMQSLKDEMESLQQQHERLQHQHRILQQQMERQQQLNEDTIRDHEKIKALEIEQLKNKYERQLALQAQTLEKEFEIVLQKKANKR